MILKERTESEELRLLRFLSIRKQLTQQEKLNLSNLEKGFEGELRFDERAKVLQEERFVINDLLLQVNHSIFQVDSLIISRGIVHLLDIKFFEGDFYLEEDKLYTILTKKEYNNPVTQLNRCSTLFRQLLQNHKINNYLVEAVVIFIHPEFTLYQAPMNQPFIFPSQVNRFLNDINKTPSKLNDADKKLAKLLLSLHLDKNPYTKRPEYTYEELRKGGYCLGCNCFSLRPDKYHLVCENCGGQEKIESFIIRSVEEYRLLFSERKITTQSIYEWCQVDLSKRTITRYLKKHYKICGKINNPYFQ